MNEDESSEFTSNQHSSPTHVSNTLLKLPSLIMGGNTFEFV